jgi:hypothetical protein
MQGTQNSGIARVWSWCRLRMLAIGPIVLWVLVSPASPFAATASAATSTGQVLGGSTSQGQPVVFELSRSGRELKRALVAIDLTCTSGAMLSLPDSYLGVRLRNGRLKSSFTDSFVADGVEYQRSGSVSGRMNRSHTAILGSWRLSMTIRDPQTGETDSCESGAVSYKARQ